MEIRLNPVAFSQRQQLTHTRLWQVVDTLNEKFCQQVESRCITILSMSDLSTHMFPFHMKYNTHGGRNGLLCGSMIR